jgi:cysteinyl-tRNA synthetase
MAQRQSARTAKAFDKADQIRKQLSDMGVTVKDLPGGVSECRVAGGS